MKGTISSSKTYRYFTHGSPEKAEHLVYVLHGYGQLAEFFIRKFHHLSDKYFIIAPEGPHRFYLSGSSGRVGASWMTKEERETDIQDNIHWLDQLDQEINSNYSFKRKHLVGFSQGGATAVRWQYLGKFKADQLVIWASVFPPDLDLKEEIMTTDSTQNYFVVGSEDEFYSKEKQEELVTFYKSKGFTTAIYEGKHDIEPKTLKQIIEDYR